MVAKIFFIAALLYTSAITYFSLIVMDFKVSVAGFDPTDKMLHAGAYLFLAFLWKLFFLFKNSDFKRYTSNLWWVALACFIFGMLIEVLQGTLTSYRTPDWWDVLANSTGVLLAVFFFMVMAPTIKKLKHKVA
ncbi:VanZ family protein [Christiangramia sp. SM2212]|uniref:VanZ family protein n=1 Tax=Christiangramia sediminicola TaxID=3073267 RepID=A0ABU1ELX5_9FLAO|nr:VanZ family protein [Christiangramia sp. SM2212]MDR5589380.1 VanZ family protein [Christiangramia sp. SM2212]